MAKNDYTYTFTLRFDENSTVGEWLKAQDKPSSSVKALLHAAYLTYGEKDLFRLAGEKYALNSMQLQQNGFNDHMAEEKTEEFKEEVRDSDERRGAVQNSQQTEEKPTSAEQEQVPDEEKAETEQAARKGLKENQKGDSSEKHPEEVQKQSEGNTEPAEQEPKHGKMINNSMLRKKFGRNMRKN